MFQQNLKPSQSLKPFSVFSIQNLFHLPWKCILLSCMHIDSVVVTKFIFCSRNTWECENSMQTLKRSAWGRGSDLNTQFITRGTCDYVDSPLKSQLNHPLHYNAGFKEITSENSL